MALASGTLGSVVFNGTIVAESLSWEINPSMETPEVTPQGVAWREYIAGIRGYELSAAFNWDMANAPQLAIQNALLNGAAGSARLFVNASNYYSCATVLPTSLGVSTQVAEKAALSVSFRGSGPLVYG